MTARFCQRLIVREGDAGALLDALDAYFDGAGMPQPARAHLLLAADEIVANVTSHAYADTETAGWLEIAGWYDGPVAHLTLRDAGQAFDPRTVAMPDTTAGIDARPIGGLGILLVRRLMDGFDYARQDGCNCVSLVKRWR